MPVYRTEFAGVIGGHSFFSTLENTLKVVAREGRLRTLELATDRAPQRDREAFHTASWISDTLLIRGDVGVAAVYLRMDEASSRGGFLDGYVDSPEYAGALVSAGTSGELGHELAPDLLDRLRKGALPAETATGKAPDPIKEACWRMIIRTKDSMRAWGGNALRHGQD